MAIAGARARAAELCSMRCVCVCACVYVCVCAREINLRYSR